MNQYTLTKEIIKTCKYFKIIEYEIDNCFVEKKIIDGLEDIIFVENLNKNRLKKLLIELEKIRLNLEFS